MNMQKWKLGSGFIALFLVASLSGCGGNTQDDGGSSVETGGISSQGGVGGEALDANGRPIASRIHFEFDSSKVNEDGRVTLESHATYLSANPGVKVKMEGHGDERGTREYNLALGERRANSATKLLKVLGIDGSRIETTSYGEEKPADDGHDSSAWSKNRRVEIIYSDN